MNSFEKVWKVEIVYWRTPLLFGPLLRALSGVGVGEGNKVRTKTKVGTK